MCQLVCDPACKICNDGTIYSCSECNPGYYLQANSQICLNRCPSGTKTEENPPECIEDEFSVCFDFDANRRNYESARASIRFISGISEADGELSDPIPAYLRGLYFSQDYFGQITGLVMSHTFTIEIWTRIQANGEIYSISTDIVSDG